MKTISKEYAQELIDFAPTVQTQKMGFAESQLEGSVAALNMLARNRIAYLGDEVGMGKTYVALAVMSMLRFQQPDARMMVIAPRENIQQKWIKEQGNFIRSNWRNIDHRVKGLDGQSVRGCVACSSIEQLASAVQMQQTADLILRATSFSVGVKTKEARKRCRLRLQSYAPWVDRRLLRTNDAFAFRDNYGRVLNSLIPEIDLLVIDESHNFKHGFSDRVSNRNRILGLALGHPQGISDQIPWFGPRVKRLLLLSATPFECDYADLHRQLQVFGFGGAKIVDCQGNNPLSVSELSNEDNEVVQREVLSRFLIRRVQHMRIGGEKYSKNMYRREWRQGGVDAFDRPMSITDPKQRLVVGLMQKKVAEVLGDRRFNNRFQIGMLSSFESFMETMRKSQVGNSKELDGEGSESAFDGDQQADAIEKQGVDSHSLERVVTSYREQFKRSLPHPKLDATAKKLSKAFDSGDKSLVFVRRIATVTELQSKLGDLYDQHLRERFDQTLPGMQAQIADLFEKYKRTKRSPSAHDSADEVLVDDAETVSELTPVTEEDDEGGTETFFSYFFRGKGSGRVLSGAAMQRNRFASEGATYSTFFEDNYVAWLLGYPADVCESLSLDTGIPRVELISRLRELAFAFFRSQSQRSKGYPRRPVYEAYQFAGLSFLSKAKGDLSTKAAEVLRAMFSISIRYDDPTPSGFPGPEDFLGGRTFFTELAARDELCRRLWPDEILPAHFSAGLRRREQRRTLLSAMSRLGASYIDLYLLAIAGIQSFDLKDDAAASYPAERLIADYIELLESQMQESTEQPKFNAFSELSCAAEVFDTLIAVNFADVHQANVSEFATIVAQSLQKQQPIGGVFGGVNKRLVKQFRMPGYPLVLITTDVLQEGEDLHTFCRRVLHYGISWTPSAMEQRTGRVDRIGSLAQRNLEVLDREPQPEELIQVHYPHLADTVERLQVRKVLQRLNRFMTLIHERKQDNDSDSSIYLHRELLQTEELPKCIEGLLPSGFPVSTDWLSGSLGKQHIRIPKLDDVWSHFESVCEAVIKKLPLHVPDTSKNKIKISGWAALSNLKIVPWEQRATHPHHREQPISITMRSRSEGDAIIVRISSPVGGLKLINDAVVDHLYDLQRELDIAKICTSYETQHNCERVSVEADLLFSRNSTQQEEFEHFVSKILLDASKLAESLRQSEHNLLAFSTERAHG